MQEHNFRTISQMDIVPTISLLLGIPVPFGNLGVIIPELFLQISPPFYAHIEKEVQRNQTGLDDEDEEETSLADEGAFFEMMERQWGDSHSSHSGLGTDGGYNEVWLSSFERLNRAMNLNCWQIHNYLTSYAQISTSFPMAEINKLTTHFFEANKLLDDLSKERNDLDLVDRIRLHYSVFKKYYLFQKQVLDTCRRLWATFDVASMVWGILLLLVSLVVIILLLLLPYLSVQRHVMEIDTVRLKQMTRRCDAPFLVNERIYLRPVLFGTCFGLLFSALMYGLVELCSFDSVPAAFLFDGYSALVGMGLIGSLAGFVYSLIAHNYLHHHSYAFSLTLLANNLVARASFLDVSCLFLYILHGVGLFSNSYIEAEDHVIYYLLTSSLCFYFIQAVRRDMGLSTLIKIALLSAFLRFSPSLQGRHERGFTEEMTLPFGSLQASASHVDQLQMVHLDFAGFLHVFFSFGFILETVVPLSMLCGLFFFATRRFWQNCGLKPHSYAERHKFFGFKMAMALINLFGLVSTLSVACYRTLQRSAMLDACPYLWKVIFPRIVYVLAIASTTLLLLLTRALCRHKTSNIKEDDEEKKQKKKQARSGDDDGERMNSMSAAFLILMGNISWPVLLVLGPSSAWTITFLFLASLLFLDISNDFKKKKKKKTKTKAGHHHHHLINEEEEEEEESNGVGAMGSYQFSEVIVWCLLSMHFFFKTGHTCYFDSLQFESAFVGFEEMNMLAGGALVVLNTFASYFLFIVGLPLMVVWRHSFKEGSGFFFFFFFFIDLIRTRLMAISEGTPTKKPLQRRKTVEEEEEEEVEKEEEEVEVVEGQDENAFSRKSVDQVIMMVFRVVLVYMLFFVGNLSITSIFIMGIKRHLMVWKVFAPKYVFDALTAIIVDLCLVAVYTITHVWSKV